MAVTALADVFVPEVIGDLTTDILFEETPLLRSGVVTRPKDAIWNMGGNTVTFPYFETVKKGIVQDNPGATRTGVTPSKILMGSYQETVTSKIVSFDFDKRIFEDVLSVPEADPMAHVAELVASESALEIQRDLVLKAQATPFEKSVLGDTTKTMTVDAIAVAKGLLGEHGQMAMPTLFLHTKQFTDLSITSDYKSLASASTLAIVRDNRGVGGQDIVGVVHGVALQLMDSVRNQASIPAISSITRADAVATVTTEDDHDLVVGDEVTISGATQTEYNGTFVVASTPTSTTFTFAVSGSPATPATGSPVFTANYTSFMAWPNALGLVPKKDVQGTIKDVHAGTTVATADFDFRWASTLRRVRPRRVIKLRTR